MKKLMTAVLCLMMVFCVAVVASAEGIESLFDGAWVQFEDGFEIYLPADWYAIDCTEEMNAKGIFYMAGTEDMAYSCTLAWSPLEKDCSVEELQAAMAAVYPDAKAVEVNGVGLVAYVDADNGLLNCLALDATEPGFYVFAFSPADDEDFANLAALIAASIRNL